MPAPSSACRRVRETMLVTEPLCFRIFKLLSADKALFSSSLSLCGDWQLRNEGRFLVSSLQTPVPWFCISVDAK